LKNGKVRNALLYMGLTGLLTTVVPFACGGAPLRIMPVGDSITRGTYMSGNTIANPLGGGYRKPLQDSLRAAGWTFEFVGELDYWAYGADGVVDPLFSPKHHGLAGFSNTAILNGGVVPTPQEVLDAKGVSEISVPGIVESLARNKPDIVLLMSGANGFDANARDLLIQTICNNFTGSLFVASITPQKAPRTNWDQVAPYNASLPSTVQTLRTQGHDIRFVDMYAALSDDDISADGVHPTLGGLQKIADTWFSALVSGEITTPITVFADAAGGTIYPAGMFTPKEVICGTGDVTKNLFYNGVMFFQLPANRIETADLALAIHLLYGSWTNAQAAVDVWGLGYTSAPLMNTAWMLTGDADARSLINTWPNDIPCVKIADNLIAVGQNVAVGDTFTLNAGQQANLLAFLNGLYAKGALPGDYAALRANPDVLMTVSNTTVRFGGSGTTSPDRRPRLMLAVTDDPAPTQPDFEFRHYSHTNDGTVAVAAAYPTYDLISGTFAPTPVDGSGIVFFALPEQPPSRASLDFTVASFYGGLHANIDVWGLGYTNVPVLNKTWLCTNDVDGRVLLSGCPPVKLADNIVTAGQTMDTGDVWRPSDAQRKNLCAYLNLLYGRGAKPGDFAVIRLNMDASEAGGPSVRGVRWGGSHQTSPDRRAALTGAVPATTNYLSNAGFEEGTGGVPTRWTTTANGFLGQRTNLSARSRSYAFRMAVNGTPGVTNTANNLNIAQDVMSPAFAGRLVTLSGYVRHNAAEPLVSNSAQKVEVRIYWLGGSQGNTFVTSTDYHNLLPTDVRDAYRPIYISAVAPADVNGIKAMIIFRSGTNVDPAITNGAAFVDDLRLTVFEFPSPSRGTELLLY